MAVGCLGSMITGASMPVFIALMGDLLNNLNEADLDFAKVINQKCIEFVIIAAFNVCSGFMQVCGWSIAGERLSKRYKERYVHAILSQEVGWFDTCGAGELATKVSDLGGKLQDGLTRKLSDLVQYVLQFMVAFATALYLCWQLAVVLLASFPLIAISGYFMIQAVSAAQNETSGQYAKAGGLATEMLSSIRTVTALNDQPSAIAKYRKFILDAMEVGLLKAFKVGLGNGITFGVSYGTYALGFW
jgi:ABC-type multidrug transport system fused ATPase/permease subunit